MSCKNDQIIAERILIQVEVTKCINEKIEMLIRIGSVKYEEELEAKALQE